MFNMKNVWLLSAFLSFHGVGLAADWPQFRGPGGSAVSTEDNIPVQWSAKDGIAWKVPLSGRGLSCPVVAKDRLYLTSSSGYKESRLHVLAFDPKNGAKLWERQFQSTGNTTCHPKTCMAAPTPVTDGERVFALFACGDVAALDRDGNLLWYRSLATDYPDITNMVGMASSPALWKDVLVLPMDNAGDSFVLAIDAKTGKNLWKLERPRTINWTTPLVADHVAKGANVVLQTDNSLVSVDANTGKEIWSISTTGPTTIPSPTLSDGLLLAPGKETLVLDPSNGGNAPALKWKSSKLVGGYASPLVHKGVVYGMSSIGLNAMDARDGKEIGQIRMKGPFSGSPIIAGNHLYLVNEEGTGYVVKLGEKLELVSTNELKDTILCTPAIHNGKMYLRSDSSLYCIGNAAK
jgi:outer membrane protein assembly factor BamB